ncbi:SGNH/GDSL hydrolase family protein [Hufsiella ginkgonis]|uniref:SGNH/GDSL hydrolase family protein n=1 Tax=Hufsiella ginkgonis TaxID=2695274 RepID=A0A7K1XU48_9SPHI|nr:GDSL-type esterase/lipase family protein [Hufsiella ginkgonis]MXV14502.1 SGNH/GDSL hydrolase family protein [Hufsiella ginkgonis]
MNKRIRTNSQFYVAGTSIAAAALLFFCLALRPVQQVTPQACIPRSGLPGFFRKLEKGKPVTIAYLGGSITEAPGYRIQTEEFIRKTYPSTKLKTINAGVGGTGSYLGVFRLGPDVLSQRPDLVFIEFAVNDAKGDSLKICNAVEGIIRQVRRANKHTDICFLYTIYEPMIADYRRGVLPASVRYMEQIAKHYQLPSINLAYDVLGKMNNGTLVFHGEKDKNYGTQVVFTLDGTHPTTDGHRVYTATIATAFGQLKNRKEKSRKNIPPLYAGNLDRTSVVAAASFTRYGNWRPGTELPELKPFVKSFPDLVYTTSPNDSLVLEFTGDRLGISDVMGPSSGTALLNIDGKPFARQRFDEFTTYYRRSFFFIDSLGGGKHRLTLKLGNAPIDKLKMLRPGDPGERTRYQRYELYVGNVMLTGKALINPGTKK